MNMTIIRLYNSKFIYNTKDSIMKAIDILISKLF